MGCFFFSISPLPFEIFVLGTTGGNKGDGIGSATSVCMHLVFSSSEDGILLGGNNLYSPIGGKGIAHQGWNFRKRDNATSQITPTVVFVEASGQTMEGKMLGWLASRDVCVVAR